MTVTITPRWGGPTDSSSDSKFLIERTLDGTSYSSLAASQAAASPYTAPSAILTADFDWQAASLGLSTTASITASGYGTLDDAAIWWTEKNADGLTGVTWLTGGGTYVQGTAFYETNQSYEDADVAASNAVLYRITHYNAASQLSGPAYFWYYAPPLPDSPDHCVIIVQLMSDLGWEPLAGASITTVLQTNDQWLDNHAGQLVYQTSSSKRTVTDNFGLAYIQCYRDSARGALAGSDANYTFTITACGQSLTLTSASIPDRQSVFLKDILA